MSARLQFRSTAKELDMSGFDTSQPITDEAVLDDVDDGEKAAKPKAADPPAEPDELHDATPGPR
jgi:hypothetical protein